MRIEANTVAARRSSMRSPMLIALAIALVAHLVYSVLTVPTSSDPGNPSPILALLLIVHGVLLVPLIWAIRRSGAVAMLPWLEIDAAQIRYPHRGSAVTVALDAQVRMEYAGLRNPARVTIDRAPATIQEGRLLVITLAAGQELCIPITPEQHAELRRELHINHSNLP